MTRAPARVHCAAPTSHPSGEPEKYQLTCRAESATIPHAPSPGAALIPSYYRSRRSSVRNPGWLADHFHQRVDQAPRFLGGLFGERHQQGAEVVRLVLLGYDLSNHEVAAL